MGDWYGTTRSNYFKVKDEQSFRDYMSSFATTIIEKEGRFAFLSDTYSGGIPTIDNTDLEEPISVLRDIHLHLSEDSICVVQSSGAENKRYVTGVSIAIAHTGERVELSLDDIYQSAQEEFGGDFEITTATY